MDNSIYLLHQLMGQLTDLIKGYGITLKRHAVDFPKEILDNAVKTGFPEDIYRFYMYKYFEAIQSQTEILESYIHKDFLSYLQNVSFNLKEAMNVGSGSYSSSVLTDYSSNTQTPLSIMSAGDLTTKMNQLLEKNETAEKNNRDLEKTLGIKQGIPMSIIEADKQNANPHLVDEFIEDPSGNYKFITGVRYRRNPEYDPNLKEYYEQFKINCATCATAYALRLRGFDVKAKGNVKKSGSLNEEISNASEYLKVWKNMDGTPAKAIHTDDWMKDNGINKMTINDYREYFNETCKEKGVYVVMVRYSDDMTGHATILQRESDGVLYYIEPQRYEMSKGDDGKRNIDDLLMRPDGSQNLSSNPSHGYGVLRVDDKLFNTDYADIFEI